MNFINTSIIFSFSVLCTLLAHTVGSMMIIFQTPLYQFNGLSNPEHTNFPAHRGVLLSGSGDTP